MGVHGQVVAREECPECGSRDNVARYQDGYAKCFGYDCEWYQMPEGELDERGHPGLAAGRSGADTGHGRAPLPVIEDLEYVDLPARGISSETCERFKYGVGFLDGDGVQVARYGKSQKVRRANKSFAWFGGCPGTLFGQELWRTGGKKIVVTEGEIDALSYAEATGCKWPVVSLPNGAGGAADTVRQNVEYLESFGEVYLMFDMDEPGQAAAAAAAEVLTPGKTRICVLPEKDANDVLLKHGPGALARALWEAKVHRPDGIVPGIDLIDALLTPPEQGLAYPWPSLNQLTHGQRRGEMVTWIAGTGAGKSQVLREVAYSLYTQHKEKVGIIALEESNRNSAEGLVSLALNVPLQNPVSREAVQPERLEDAARQLLGGFSFYDHWGSVESDVLLPKIRYLAHAGHRWIVLDHLSIMVSGMAAEGDERKRLDQLTTRLRSLVSELDIGLHIVSHLRKADGTPHEEGGRITLQDIRGSGAPAQLSNFVIALERNQQAEGDKKNLTTLRVLKNRLTGDTGEASWLRYDKQTGRLNEADPDFEDEEGY